MAICWFFLFLFLVFVKFIFILYTLQKDKSKYRDSTSLLHMICYEANWKKRPWSDISDFLQLIPLKALTAMAKKQRRSNHQVEMNSSNAKDDFTPIHIATRNAPLDVFEELLSLCHEAASLRDHSGSTPLARAMKYGNIPAAELLIKVFPEAISMMNDDEVTPLEHANNVSVLRILFFAHSKAPTEIEKVLSYRPGALVRSFPFASTPENAWTSDRLLAYFKNEGDAADICKNSILSSEIDDFLSIGTKLVSTFYRLTRCSSLKS